MQRLSVHFLYVEGMGRCGHVPFPVVLGRGRYRRIRVQQATPKGIGARACARASAVRRVAPCRTGSVMP
jgi:hypothetical protein